VTQAPPKVNIKITVPKPPAPPAQAPVAPPAASSLRDVGYGISAGPNTSDVFALNVASAWDGIPGIKYVYSPVTGQTYAMHYQIVGNSVIATGGNGAYVQF
jgi:hypothetical protein